MKGHGGWGMVRERDGGSRRLGEGQGGWERVKEVGRGSRRLGEGQGGWERVKAVGRGLGRVDDTGLEKFWGHVSYLVFVRRGNYCCLPSRSCGSFA